MRAPSVPRFLPPILPLALVLAVGCGDAGRPEARARNLLLITIDTLRADHLGVYGGRPGVSPAIDALAAEGALFERCQAPMGMTLACMATMFTSKYPDETGVRGNDQRLRDDERTLGERLAEAGFRSRGFTANGVLQPDKSGIDRGFDEHRHIQNEAWMTHVAAEILMEDFGDDAERRDFLWVHYVDPHQPYQRREPWATQFDPDYDGPYDAEEETLQRIFVEKIELQPRDLAHIEAVYDSQVRLVDQFVRSLVFALGKGGHAEDTLVVLSADHGEELYEHNRYFYHASSVYSSVTHVPLILRQPGVIPAGARVDGLVELVDILPTVLAHLGVGAGDGAAGARLRGHDLWPAIQGAPVRRDFAFAQVARQVYAVRNRDWLYVENPNGFMPRSIPEAGQYFIGRRELFDLASDPREQDNVVGAHPEVAERMAAALAAWKSGLVAAEAAEQALTDEDRARLEALGYVTGDR